MKSNQSSMRVPANRKKVQQVQNIYKKKQEILHKISIKDKESHNLKELAKINPEVKRAFDCGGDKKL